MSTAAETTTDRSARGQVGRQLKEARLAKGLSIAQVAADLRIRSSHLHDIETGHFADFPSPTYAYGFVRNYSEYLGLDAAATVAAYREEFGAAMRAPELKMPIAPAERSVPGGAVVLVSLTLAIGAYGVWYAGTLEPEDRVEPAAVEGPVAPGESAEAVEGDAVEEAASAEALPPIDTAAGDTDVPAQPESAVIAAVPAVEPAAGDPAVTPSTLPSADAASTANAAPQSSPVGLEVVTGNDPSETPEPLDLADELAVLDAERTLIGPSPYRASPAVSPTEAQAAIAMTGVTASRIVIEAEADSWVQLSDGRDDLLLSRVLRAGERFEVPDVAGLRLYSGNVGALAISVDGVPVARLGAPGEIVRDLPLDPVELRRTAVD